MGVADELQKLKGLLDSGALSEADYQKAKDRVLSTDAASSHAVASDASQSPDVLGIPLLLLPVAGLGLLFLAYSKISSEFRIFEARAILEGTDTLVYASLGLTIIGSAILAGIDAGRYGFGKDPKNPVKALRTSPGMWAIGHILLWIVVYPWYIDARRKASPKAGRFTVLALLLALAYAGAGLSVQAVVEGRKEAIRAHFSNLGR